MLKILDRYIIKKYLSTFFFTVLIFTMISIVIDFSEKIEDFIEEGLGVFQILSEYYINWILWINGLLFPLYALISVIFFTSRMAYNSEIISILNAGVSFRRLMRPYLIAGTFIFLLHFFGNHFFIPIGNKKHFTFQHTYVHKHDDKGKNNDVHLFIEPGTKVYIDHFNKRTNKATDFRIEKFSDNKLVYLLKAESAEWVEEPNKWKINNYITRTFDGLKEGFVNGEGERIDTIINIGPDDFVRYINHKEMMDTEELLAFINKEQSRGVGNTKVYEVELHRRTAEPFTILILTLIGFAVASRKVRGGMGFQLALGVGIGAVYIFLSKFSTTFATNEGLSPLMGVWLPNIVFFLVAMLLIFRAQK